MSEIIFRYIHFIGIMGIASSLVMQHLILSSQMDAKSFKKACIVDIVLGISAGLTLIAGLCLWFFVGQEASFYNTNPSFHIKLTLFLLIVLLSIYPTRFFLKNRKKDFYDIVIPKTIIMLVRVQLLIVFIIPLFGVFISRGYSI